MARNQVLDLLKLVLAAMVVGIHGGFFSDLSPEWSHFLVDYLFRAAVPIFFMVNGFYAAHVVGDTKRFGNWALRISQLFAFWSLIYSPFFLPGVNDFKSFMYVMFVGFYHLWYLPATLAAGAVLHLMRRVPDKVVMIIMACAYMLGLWLQYSGNYHVFRRTDYDRVLQYYPIYRNFLCSGLPFFGMGLFIARKNLVSTLSPGTVNRLILGGLLMMGAEYLFNQALGVHEGLDLLWSLPVLCCGIFLKAMTSLRVTASTEAGDLSSLIYFLHPLVLKKLNEAGWHAASFNVFLTLFIITLLAPLLVKISRGLKRYTGISAL